MAESNTKATQTFDSRPSRVDYALVALWVAWANSALALIVSYFVYQWPGIRLGTAVGLVGLILQAIVFVHIGRGSNVARILILVILLIGTPGLLVRSRVVATQSMLSAAVTSTGFFFRGSAIFLLFTGTSRPWFKRDPASLTFEIGD